MGNVHAASSSPTANIGGIPVPDPLGSPPPTKNEQPTPSIIPEETGPGSFEDLHKKTKDVFPMNFEGAKLIINKGLSSHFQINHNLTMSSLQPSGYKFGCTYVGSKQYSPTEAYPVLVGDIDASGSMTAQIIHQFTANTRCKYVSQIQNGKWLGTQITGDLKGKDYIATLTLGNIDIVNSSGLIVSQYLQNVTKRLALGAEILYQYGANVPGNHLAIYTLASRYTTPKWEFSGNITPAAGALHSCFYRRINDTLQIGVELEGSLRNQECTGTIGYQIEVPSASVTFKGQLDSNWCVGATMEKRLLPLPFTFLISGYANHVKGAYRFGLGLVVG